MPDTQRMLGLLADPPARPETGAGYLDLLGPDRPGPTSLAGALMNSTIVPKIYERWWRPALGRAAKGLRGPSMAEEHHILRRLLALRPGDIVLDVACGPGNFTRSLSPAVGATGLVVGIDSSATMLTRAVQDTEQVNVGYLRGDAVDLPLASGTVDAVCCFAALHLFDHPMRALDAMTRALVPGGRLALLTSCRPAPVPFQLAADIVARVAGIAMFGPGEITAALADRGFRGITQQVAGGVQFVGGTRT